MKDVSAGLLIAGLVVIVLLLAPMLVLWGLNTISEAARFGWQIPHGWATYFAVWAILLPIGGSGRG